MSSIKRYSVQIYGLVQGIGYRPYIYKIAKELNIKGWVNNFDSSVAIDMEGEEVRVREFLRKVVEHPPKLGRIQKVEVKEEEPKGYKDFKIEKSIAAASKFKFLLPDIAICDKCIEDIFNKNSKRYRYPFTNCTDCGPRYSIIKGLPYDRASTTMRNFKMCNDCDKEYKSPESRRFHAQPNCCTECGPKLILLDNKGKKINCEDEINRCIELLKTGKILAIKGIGGFHIVCDAFNEKSVEEIRIRKRRPHKPLAVMVSSIEIAKGLCFIDEKEEEVLTSNRRPILLLKKRDNNLLTEFIATGVKKLGIMLPYTPLHHLLFSHELKALVMTSGNLSGRPIEYKNEEALMRLKDIVDYFLINDREINTPIDDSVVKVVDRMEMVSRLGRGYAPFALNRNIGKKILACGSEMKSTFSFSHHGIAYISQYLGDLKELDSYEEYKRAIRNLSSIFEYTPEAVAYDIHKGYMPSVYGISQKKVQIEVQHHHAHMVSCMLENNLYDEAIGVIYDGTGLGLDNNIWGGEFFIGSRKNFKRVGKYKYAVIQGGDSAQEDIWKIGLSYIYSLNDKRLREKGIDVIKQFVDEKEVYNINKALEKNINCFKTSSVGRLFDAAASILGVRENISYDGQGAIELENVADTSIHESYEYLIEESSILKVDYSNIFKGILEDIEKQVSVSEISSKFHNTIVSITVDMVCRLRNIYKLNKVILSGGVFENEYLLVNIVEGLKKNEFKVFFNRSIPINDSGISFGQIGVCDEVLKGGC
ncbi:carbamoyltransferase HypF [Clostridium bovifaecis]|uniref:Carbamoyltransferase n=1 Tax=Clostridium bovifaecis TaxID=2184719 RepID=A0A6I6F043_9CLOT|nr:carbamoyltransferase HypF [Clostridium bovifaecis]